MNELSIRFTSDDTDESSPNRLDRLSGEAPTPPAPQASPPPRGEGERQRALAQLREQWEPVIDVIVTVAEAGVPLPEGLDAFLGQIGVRDDWRALVPVLRRILAGERDPQALLPGLDATDTVIAGEVLRGLGVETGVPRLLEPEDEAEGEPMDLDDLFDLVAQACRPDAPPGLGEQLHAITHKIARDPDAPAELQALCRVLNRVLSGERDPDLSDLPPRLAQGARRMLDAM